MTYLIASVKSGILTFDQGWHTDVGPVLAHRRWANIGILTLAQHGFVHWANVGTTVAYNNWRNISMQSWANVGSTLAQLTNPCWPNAGVPTLAQCKGWCWAIIAMLAGLTGSQFNTPWGYRQVSNIRRTLVGNKMVDHSDVGAAPTTSSFST